MNRIVFSKWRCFLLLLIAALLVGMYQAQSNQPRNLRIVREDPGGDDDRLIARWDPPPGGASLYYYRTRRKSSSARNWPPWPISYTNTTGTSVTLLRPSGIPEDKAVDIQIQVDAGREPGPIASAYNVWRIPPAPRRKGPTPTPTPKPQVRTCEVLSNSDSGIVVSSPHGLDSGIQCQRIGAAGIGIASIIESGFINAVDLWGNVQQAQVCFSQESGSFIFLDATTIPKSMTTLDGYRSMGMVCADIDRIGSVILIPSSEPLPEYQQAEVIETEAIQPEVTQAETVTPAETVTQVETVSQAELPQVETQPLSGCWIWTNYILNLRAAPVNGAVLALVPYDVGLTAYGRSEGWLQVDWLGTSGWISADLVRAVGNCG